MSRKHEVIVMAILAFIIVFMLFLVRVANEEQRALQHRICVTNIQPVTTCR